MSRGFALEGWRPNLLYHDVAIIKDRRSPSVILQQIRPLMRWVLKDFRPDVVVVERTFIGRNQIAVPLNVVKDELAILALR